MSFWKKYTSVFTRLQYLEEREVELTAALVAIRKEQAKSAEARLELDRILPLIRAALATFSAFNKTY